MCQNADVCQECLRYYNSGKTGGLNCAESTSRSSKLLGIDSDAIYLLHPLWWGLPETVICGSLAAGLMLMD